MLRIEITTINSSHDSTGATNKDAVTAIINRSCNVVIRGVPEDRNNAIWHDVLSRVLHTAAGRDVHIDDAFRLGSFGQGRARPVLVKLKSAWDRRLVLSGSRRLADVPEFRRKIYVAADESPEERRRSMMDRMKRILARDGHDVYVNDGVLFSDGVAKFCVRRGFLNTQSSDNGETSIRTVNVVRSNCSVASGDNVGDDVNEDTLVKHV